MLKIFLNVSSPVVVSHVLRPVVSELHISHDLELHTGDLYGLFEHDPGDRLTERRSGETAQVGPVTLACWQEPCRVDWFLQSKSVSLPRNILQHFTQLPELRMFITNLGNIILDFQNN